MLLECGLCLWIFHIEEPKCNTTFSGGFASKQTPSFYWHFGFSWYQTLIPLHKTSLSFCKLLLWWAQFLWKIFHDISVTFPPWCELSSFNTVCRVSSLHSSFLLHASVHPVFCKELFFDLCQCEIYAWFSEWKQYPVNLRCQSCWSYGKLETKY